MLCYVICGMWCVVWYVVWYVVRYVVRYVECCACSMERCERCSVYDLLWKCSSSVGAWLLPEPAAVHSSYLIGSATACHVSHPLFDLVCYSVRDGLPASLPRKLTSDQPAVASNGPQYFSCSSCTVVGSCNGHESTLPPG